MRMRFFLKFLFVLMGCFLLTSCLEIEDTKGALESITADPRVEGEWYTLKWMDQEKSADLIKVTDEADIKLEPITREGHPGYKFTSKDPELQKDLESLWGLNFAETRFFLSEFPIENSKSCTLQMYEVKEDMIYAYVLKIPEAQEYLKKNYPENTKIVPVNTGELVPEVVVKTLDEESKKIIKDMSQHPELWENAVILKKKL